MRIKSTNKKVKKMIEERAREAFAEIKDSFRVVEYSHPYSMAEVVCGSSESMDKMINRGYTFIINGKGVQKMRIHKVRDLTWDDFIQYYNIRIMEEQENG